jgi:hypothetical protein
MLTTEASGKPTTNRPWAGGTRVSGSNHRSAGLDHILALPMLCTYGRSMRGCVYVRICECFVRGCVCVYVCVCVRLYARARVCA